MNIEKINYCKERYLEEIKRFEHLENKSAKFITFISLIITALLTIANLDDGFIFKHLTALGIINLFLFSGSLICIICSWGHALSSIKIQDGTAAAKNKLTLDYIKYKDDETALSHIFDCYSDSIQKIEEELDYKSNNLEKSYNELVCTAFFFFPFLILTFVLKSL